jgi:quercetin dioxygenase-like cupin family protein
LLKKTFIRPGSLLALAPPAVALALVLIAARTANSKALRVVPEHARVEQLLRTSVTTSGDAIRAPDGLLEMIVSKYHIAPQAVLPVHQHPSPRYGYVLAGTLMVTNVETRHSTVFQAGSAIVEDVGRWHEARTLGPQPVELLVLDLVKPGASNVVLRQ